MTQGAGLPPFIRGLSARPWRGCIFRKEMLSGYTQTSSIHGQTPHLGAGAGVIYASTMVMEAGQIDPLLLPLVRASDVAESERLLASLISDHAEPVVTKIIGYKMRGSRGDGALDEAEDVRGEVMLQLVRRLQGLRQEEAARPIRDFGAYVAAATYNACDRYVSRKYPQRRRLKNGLRYLLTHRPGFALWQTAEGAWVGGLHGWRASPPPAAKKPGEGMSAGLRLQQLRDDPRVFGGWAETGRDLCDPKNAYELLAAVFSWTGVPVEIDLLTGVVAEWWGVKDCSVEIEGGGARDDGEAGGVQLADGRPGPSVETERRVYLERLWREIVELPPRQRAALLLNLRDEHGRGVIDLWMLTGVATTQAVAGVLAMTLDEFAAMWRDLPLDDNRIAAHLQVTRQQVINLRKSARERLARRMKGF